VSVFGNCFHGPHFLETFLLRPVFDLTGEMARLKIDKLLNNIAGDGSEVRRAEKKTLCQYGVPVDWTNAHIRKG
jgi:hypothetical protein